MSYPDQEHDSSNLGINLQIMLLWRQILSSLEKILRFNTTTQWTNISHILWWQHHIYYMIYICKWKHNKSTVKSDASAHFLKENMTKHKECEKIWQDQTIL